MEMLNRRALGAAAAGALSGALLLSADARAERLSGRPRAPVQFRGMWIATVTNRDWPSRAGLPAREQRAQLLTLLDTAVKRRLNAVMLQVRPTADALWPSPFEPWAECLTGTQGKDPGWDPLGVAVEEAHRRGLQLHAWFNPYRVAMHTDRDRLARDHPARVHPDWTIAYGGKLYYDPGLPEVREFVQDAMLDAVVRYPVDGMHWDDYFYPYPVVGEEFDDADTYARYGDGFNDIADWRRSNVDRLVQGMSRRLRRARPRVAFGISPFGVWRNKATDSRGSNTSAGVETYDDLYADTRKWVRREWIDHIVPQLYWNIGFPAADYAELVSWWSRQVSGTSVRLNVGEALYKVGAPGQPEAWKDPAELSRHLSLCKRYREVKGNVFFAAREVVSDPLKAMSRVVADHYGQVAEPPPIGR